MMERPENFFMVKQGISFHSNMKTNVPDFHYGVRQPPTYHGAMDQGQISERGMAHMIECVIAMKEVLGDKVSAWPSIAAPAGSCPTRSASRKRWKNTISCGSRTC